MRYLRVSLVIFLVAAGCNADHQVAPVSGQVKLNGKPLANADVHFQPIGSKNNPNPGPGSHGRTDAMGNYTLRIDDKQSGALVGKHWVMIYAFEPAGSKSDAGSPGLKDKIPMRYNEKSNLTCDVPKAGRTDADFELKSP